MSIEIVTSQHSEIINQLQTLNSKSDNQINLLQQINAALGGTPAPMYSVTVTASAVGANKHHLVLTNNNTTKLVKIRKIFVSAEVTATVTGYEIGLRLVRVNNVSGGTSITIAKFDTNDADPSNVSAVTAPTSANVLSTLIAGSINPEETGGQTFIELYRCGYGEKPITLRNGESISLQQYGTAGVGSLNVTIVFSFE